MLTRKTSLHACDGRTIARRTLSCFAFIAIGTALLTTTSSAQIGIGSGLRIDAPARSMKDLRDQNLVKQRFDFSCGAAALATLLRYGLGDAVTEGQILTDLFNRLSDDEKTVVRSTGFSLLHLQRVAEGRDYNAQGFRLEPEQLSMLDGPVIVFIEPRGYKHFAVLRAVRGDRVYLADPSRGNVRMPTYTFLDTWLQDDGKGIIFVVEPKTRLPGISSLRVPAGKGRLFPEIMTAREMLAVGSPLLTRPEHSR